MSDALFPILPGLTWDITYSPSFDNVEQRSKNGAVTVLMNDPYPQWSFELSYEFLRDAPGQVATPRNPKNYPELQQLVGFFLQRGGNADTFLLDPELLTGKREPVAAHQIGTGDGATTVFYLVRDLGGYAMEVQDPIPGSVKVMVNGAVVSGWTLGTKGDITFAAAPAESAVITASFRWRWSVRFAQSSQQFKAFMFDLYEADSVKLIQDKR
ncbi:TIGR02217 family protein [Bryocella elongata]|uniref:TIGR02217 family protein n=1 Tax=Bryocella elongata TaxID=863522 RepID=A0A1H6B7D5_9BACT|nr:DUF2460 domain-containing protein [Bryocella elongata]SEG56444.1 TIGR02217 family protein [Bryocella elongata]